MWWSNKVNHCNHNYSYIGQDYESSYAGCDTIMDRVHVVYCKKCNTKTSVSTYSQAMILVRS